MGLWVYVSQPENSLGFFILALKPTNTRLLCTLVLPGYLDVPLVASQTAEMPNFDCSFSQISLIGGFDDEISVLT